MDYSGCIIDNRYQLIQLIDRGGMGAVYWARHVQSGGELAIKLLRPEYRNDKAAMTRFVREAQTVARIKHPNVVEVFGMGFTDWKEPYIAMQYLHGYNVASILDRVNRPLSIFETCGIVVPILRALNAIHADGIIHRDIKPSNIIVEWTGSEEFPVVKLIDFGISKVNRNEAIEITRVGTVVGTLEYMSPEQMSGGPVQPNTDLWSVGVLLFRMLMGRLPYLVDVRHHFYSKIMSEDPIPSVARRGRFPKGVVSIIERALARDSQTRYQTAWEMLKDLASIDGCEQRNRALTRMVEGISSVSPGRHEGHGEGALSDIGSGSSITLVTFSPNQQIDPM